MPESPAPATPCIGLCRMQGDFCVGCRRTLDEIARWPSLGDAERRRIMRELLPARTPDGQILPAAPKPR